MRNIIRTEELIKKRFSEEKAKQIINEANAEIEDLRWGGSRTNSGRKTIIEGKVLKFTKRVTEKEAQFIDYARKHNINYEDLMQG